MTATMPDAPQLYAAEDARRGRNELAACGSGRMRKSCHRADSLAS